MSKKYWSKLDEEKRLCQMWLKEPLVNPETGMPIERNGPTFNDWKERCKAIGLDNRPVATKEMTWRKCQEWKRNPLINPDTGRKIRKDGKIYKWIEKQCNLIEEKELQIEGDYYVPDHKGMVPCVLYRGTWYVIRKHENRKVWGPLNKPAKNIKLVWFKDTWDYTQNHYRPVFIGTTPSKPAVKKILNKKTTDDQGIWLKTFTVKTEPSRNNPKNIVDSFVDLFIDQP